MMPYLFSNESKSSQNGNRFTNAIVSVFAFWKLSYLIKLSFDCFLQISNYQSASAGSDNCSAPNRQQPITLIIDGWFSGTYMCHLASISYIYLYHWSVVSQLLRWSPPKMNQDCPPAFVCGNPYQILTYVHADDSYETDKWAFVMICMHAM